MGEKPHRKIWKAHHGEIPKGKHIHHLDGNRENNHISNLICLSAEDHYKLHKSQGDMYAAMFLGIKGLKNPKHSEFMKRNQHTKGKFVSGITNEMIEERLGKMSQRAMGRELGISHKTIGYRIKTYNLKTQKSSDKS